MAVNLLTMRRMVRDRLGVPPNDGFMTDQILDTNINLAISVFESEQRWPWNETETTVTIPAGTSSVALPEDWRAMRAVIVGTHVLEEMALFDMHQLADTSGIPTTYTVLDATLRVAPTPPSDTTVTILYYRTPVILVNDSDAPRVPSEHVNALIAKACQLCSTRESERTHASDHLTEYLTGVARARKDINRSNTRGVGRRIRPGNWV